MSDAMPGDVIAPGAFKSQIGKTVPVVDKDKNVIGEATVLDKDGNVSIRMNEVPDAKSR